MVHFSKTGIFGLIGLFILVFFLTYTSRNSRLFDEGALWTDNSIEVLLYQTADVETLTQQLDSLNVDFSKKELIWAANTLGWRRYQPGRYVISGGDSYSSFMSKMGRGIQDPGTVTVLPGIDRERLAKRLAEQLRADSASFRKLFEDSSAVAQEFGLTGEQLFSRMLPETYQMYWTSSPESAVRRIHAEFQKAVVDPYKNEIEESNFDLNEIVTLASIVEGEAQHNEEKPKISGLYLNRLDRNMLLQADPTVIYAVGERRRLLYADYEMDHPYNTYRIAGLPPGPIANPDLHSIRAVLFPATHNYLYMVATPEGTHRFSETYAEHQQASEEWREWLQEQYRIKRERERQASES